MAATDGGQNNFVLFFGVENVCIVFLTHDNIWLDTKIAGLPRAHDNLYKFEEISKMASKKAL